MKNNLINFFRKIVSYGQDDCDAVQFFSETSCNNPYIAARNEWNAMYGSLIKAKYNWQIVGLGLLLSNFVLVGGIVWQAMQAKIIPYVIKVDSLGQPAIIGPVKALGDLSPQVIAYQLGQFVINARSIIADPVAQKRSLDFVYDHAQGAAVNVLNEYFHSNQPFQLSRNKTVSVQINSVLPKSDVTWQISWTEITRNPEGQLIGQTRFEGLIGVSKKTVVNAEEAAKNPFGLYVTQLNWTQRL